MSFDPIRTNVPGIDICEHLPLQATIADKFSIVRGIRTFNSHDPDTLLTGFPPPRADRPSFGSVVSRTARSRRDHSDRTCRWRAKAPRPTVRGPVTWARPIARSMPRAGVALDNLSRNAEITVEPVGRPTNAAGIASTIFAATWMLGAKSRDGFVPWPGVRDAQLDARRATPSTSARNPPQARAKYGQANQLPAGAAAWSKRACRWSTSATGPTGTITTRSFPRCAASCRRSTARSTRCSPTSPSAASISHVTVLLWGEMGRSPRIGTETGRPTGRDHWRKRASPSWPAAASAWARPSATPARAANACRPAVHAAEHPRDALPRPRHRPDHDLPQLQRPAHEPARRPQADSGVDLILHDERLVWRLEQGLLVDVAGDFFALSMRCVTSHWPPSVHMRSVTVCPVFNSSSSMSRSGCAL